LCDEHKKCVAEPYTCGFNGKGEMAVCKVCVEPGTEFAPELSGTG